MKEEKYHSSFLLTSYDKAKDESLLWDERKKVLNFDDIASDIYARFREGENLTSADAYAETKDRRLFIEFKNQRLSRVDNRAIRKKAFDTIALYSLLKEKREVKDKKNTYIVVYREDDIPSWSRFRSKALEYSGVIKSHPILFGLEKFLYFYSDIWTMDVDSFFSSSLYKAIEEWN